MIIDFHLHRREDLDAGLVRVVEGRVEAALELIMTGTDDRAEDVHDVRTICKRLRAVWRLVRPRVGDELYRAENARIRDAARTLSQSRDDTVARETVDSFLERDDLTVDERAAFEAVAASIPDRQPDRDVDVTLGLVGDELRRTALRFAEAGLRGSGFELIEPGLKVCYRRGRRDMKRVREADDDDVFHDYRKRVKYLWYQLRLLERASPSIESMLADLKILQRDLGDDHDLVVLRDRLLADPEGHGGAERIGPAIARLAEASAGFRRSIRDLGGTFYDRKPRRFSADVAQLFEAWRGGS